MTARITRRNFLVNAAVGAGGVLLNSLPVRAEVSRLKSQFKVAVITDEISQDFERACAVASREFGMEWVELRELWNKNLMALETAQIDEVRRILGKYQLRVTDIASPLFKTDWPGAPVSKFTSRGDKFSAEFAFKEQDRVLAKSIELAKIFHTDRVRGFDFWRLEDPAPYREAINAKLAEAAAKLGKEGLTFILENEHECNTASGAEAAKTLAAIPSPNFMLNWDPGNAAAAGETPFPNGWDLLPKNRIGHCHCKDVVHKTAGGSDWAPMGKGVIDWTSQFKALKQIGYDHAVSLETHWRGAGSPEKSSRQSWAGMKAELQAAGALS